MNKFKDFRGVENGSIHFQRKKKWPKNLNISISITWWRKWTFYLKFRWKVCVSKKSHISTKQFLTKLSESNLLIYNWLTFRFITIENDWHSQWNLKKENSQLCWYQAKIRCSICFVCEWFTTHVLSTKFAQVPYF